MIVAYLIASHTNPSQIRRLIARIRAERPTAPIVIHHDPVREPLDRSAFASDAAVRFVEPTRHGAWGSFAIVQITLDGIETLLTWGVPFDYCTFISGQDYPLASLSEFESRLRLDGAIDMSDDRPQTLDRYRFDYYALPRGIQTRFVHRVFYVLRSVERVQPWLRFTSGRIGCRIGVRRSRHADVCGFRVYKGFQWWTLSQRALRYIGDFVRAQPAFVRCFSERTLIPDEAFFQTILATSPFEFDRDDGRFMRWATPDAMNPDLLTIADLDEIARSSKSFGRKFDTRTDAAILDALDERSLGRRVRV